MRDSSEKQVQPEVKSDNKAQFVLSFRKYRDLARLVRQWDSPKLSANIELINGDPSLSAAWQGALKLTDFLWNNGSFMDNLDLETEVGMRQAPPKSLKEIPQEVWVRDHKTKSGLMYDILAICDGATRLYEASPDLKSLPDSNVVEALTKFNDTVSPKETLSLDKFAKFVEQASIHEEFPRSFFDSELNPNVDQPLLSGLYEGLTGNDAEKFASLVAKLQDQVGKSGEGVNFEQCKLEAELIGFFIARNMSNEGGEYAADDQDKHPLLALRSLNIVAIESYPAFKRENRVIRGGVSPKVRVEAPRE